MHHFIQQSAHTVSQSSYSLLFASTVQGGFETSLTQNRKYTIHTLVSTFPLDPIFSFQSSFFSAFPRSSSSQTLRGGHFVFLLCFSYSSGHNFR